MYVKKLSDLSEKDLIILLYLLHVVVQSDHFDLVQILNNQCLLLSTLIFICW